MTYKYNRPAFSMIELVFVIVVIGILAAVAIPKLAMNRDSAVVAAAKSTISSIRSSLATEKQRRVLSGNFTAITELSTSTTADKPIFDGFDGVATSTVLAYPPLSCKSGATGCWVSSGGGAYIYRMPTGTTNVNFTLANNRFNCDFDGSSDAQKACKELTQSK